MKILIVSSVPTHPIIAGNRKLILSYTQLFQEWGHEVHFLYVNRYNLNKKRRQDLKEAILPTKSYWGNNYHQYNYSLKENIMGNIHILLRKIFYKGYRTADDIYPNGLKAKYLNLDNDIHFDAVIVNYFYLSKLLEFIPLSKKALFTHDSFSICKRTLDYKAAYYLSRKEEQKALKRAPYVFAMQDVEANYFKELHPKGQILINYSNYKYHIQSKIGNHNILFFSGKSIFNITGLKWFISEIFPTIQSYYSDAKLCIAGSICDSLAEYANRKDVCLIGKIEDPYTFFLIGDIAINPCFQGTGLKIKTFEALAYDKIVMAHPHSAIGIFKKDTAPIFTSEQPIEWLDFLKKVWEENGLIDALKMRNRIYMNDMDLFIKSQYHKFLD